MEEFAKLGLSKNVIEALRKKGFTTPTAIQIKAIPLLLAGKKDVVGQSQTGTGKTASFALPIIEKIKEHGRSVQAIILTPTRELAMQVAREISSLKGEKVVRIISVYGGAPIGPQRQKLRDGVDIVVGTPGRVIDLIKRKSLRLDNVKYAVLDEADEMLNMGFVEDIETILQATPKEKSMLLFSATMPKAILKIAQKYMREYEFIEVEKSQVTTRNIEQVYYDVNARDRVEALRRIIDDNIEFYGIIFCNTKATVDNLAHQLSALHYRAAALHGDITQSQREKILQQFRDKSIRILVATDVAARGIDVTDLTHVVNFSLPQSPESYVHRIGRTGRAGKKGISITFVIPSERRKLSYVEKICKCKLVKQELPTGAQIVKHKETQIKNLIKNIMEANAGKETKYQSLAEELLRDNKAGAVVSALLKYSFKNELNQSSYKDLQKLDSHHESRSGGRSKSGGYRGRSSRTRSSNQKSSGRSSGNKSYGSSAKKSFSGSSRAGNSRPRSGDSKLRRTERKGRKSSYSK